MGRQDLASFRIGLMSRKRLVSHGIRARGPIQRIVLTAITRPGIERIDDRFQLRRQLGHGAHKYALERCNLPLMLIRLILLPHLANRAVVVNPGQPERRVEFGTVAL